MTIYYRVNISRPSIYIEDQNARLCDYIEPLRETGKVRVSSCYSFNLEQYKINKSCVHGPGRKYYFWFKEKEIAQKFIDDWMNELGISEYVVLKHKCGYIPQKDTANTSWVSMHPERKIAEKWIEYSNDYYIDEECTKKYYDWTRIVEEEIEE